MSKKIDLDQVLDALFEEEERTPVATALGQPVYAQSEISMICPYKECGIDLNSAHLISPVSDIQKPRDGDVAVCMCGRLLQFHKGGLIPLPDDVKLELMNDQEAWSSIQMVVEAALDYCRKNPERIAELREIHFHSGDPRFCGSTLEGRRFTMTDSEVTCETCLESLEN